MDVRNIGDMIGSAAAGSHGDVKQAGAPLRYVERPPPKPVPTDGWNGASNIQGFKVMLVGLQFRGAHNRRGERGNQEKNHAFGG